MLLLRKSCDNALNKKQQHFNSLFRCCYDVNTTIREVQGQSLPCLPWKNQEGLGKEGRLSKQGLSMHRVCKATVKYGNGIDI